jgi:phosphoribosylcarboxyaminoimidazole (NCAIR) mutase
VPSDSASADPSLMRNTTSSPDLGIESDQGRFSSLEAASSGVQMDTTTVVSTVEGHCSNLNTNLTAAFISSSE